MWIQELLVTAIRPCGQGRGVSYSVGWKRMKEACKKKVYLGPPELSTRLQSWVHAVPKTQWILLRHFFLYSCYFSIWPMPALGRISNCNQKSCKLYKGILRLMWLLNHILPALCTTFMPSLGCCFNSPLPRKTPRAHIPPPRVGPSRRDRTVLLLKMVIRARWHSPIWRPQISMCTCHCSQEMWLSLLLQLVKKGNLYNERRQVIKLFPTALLCIE